ncbi:hypothetical protein L6452_11060 [Arctium lappa]|uniref:Uncharacterized protein n=1 Tax=Arctium lappa TaxID=4217 RepID=A0ACB9DPB9_ARCLA|nr:hypothetical protein L6452_11060 [Arctium lappa]
MCTFLSASVPRLSRISILSNCLALAAILVIIIQKVLHEVMACRKPFEVGSFLSVIPFRELFSYWEENPMQ